MLRDLIARVRDLTASVPWRTAIPQAAAAWGVQELAAQVAQVTEELDTARDSLENYEQIITDRRAELAELDARIEQQRATLATLERIPPQRPDLEGSGQ